ncbi:MAG: hypothetical protein PHR28_09010 [candidate division Zixibacteria bacterium]|jgi:hypothetical protein|nr:hypothetical protein [candidate division Zixibacteria bacterium]
MRLLDAPDTVCPECGHAPVYLRSHNKKIYCPNCDPKPRKIGYIYLGGMRPDPARRDRVLAAIRQDLTDHGFIEIMIDEVEQNPPTFIVSGRHQSPNINKRLVELPRSERLYTYTYRHQMYEVVRAGDIHYSGPGHTSLQYTKRFRITYLAIGNWMTVHRIQPMPPSIFQLPMHVYASRRDQRNKRDGAAQGDRDIIRCDIDYLMRAVNVLLDRARQYHEGGGSLENATMVTLRIPKLKSEE